MSELGVTINVIGSMPIYLRKKECAHYLSGPSAHGPGQGM